MNRISILAAALTILGAAPAPAQSHVTVELGFGLPRPYVSGYVVVGRPYHRYYYRPRPVIVIVRRPYYYHRPRVIVVDRRRHRHHHRGHRW